MWFSEDIYEQDLSRILRRFHSFPKGRKSLGTFTGHTSIKPRKHQLEEADQQEKSAPTNPEGQECSRLTS